MINLYKVNKIKHIKLSELKIVVEKNNVELKSSDKVKSFLSR